jgi:hypothetical protein
MQFRITLVCTLIVSLVLAGCIGSGGGGNTGGTDYDGVWTVSFVNSGFVEPTADTGQKMYCSTPTVSMTVVDGAGTTRQTTICQAYVTATGAKFGPELDYYDLISVSIIGTVSSGDVISAVVNGVVLTGKCISPKGCAAQGLTMTR